MISIQDFFLLATIGMLLAIMTAKYLDELIQWVQKIFNENKLD